MRPYLLQSPLNTKGTQLLQRVFVFSDNKKNIERTKLLFPVSSVNDNDNVVSLISIAIIFLVIAFFQIN